MRAEVILGDCLDVMRGMPTDSVDLVITSPPYSSARTYGIGFDHRGQDWVDWATPRYLECVRICKGLVAWVVDGQTRRFRYTAEPVLLMADLHRAGVKLRKPAAFVRVGIPGSGGPDWLRSDWEPIVCSTKGRLPWSDKTAMGHPPKWRPGGVPSYRMPNGRRVHKLHTKADADGMRLQGYNPPKLANPGNVIRCIVGGGRMGSPLAHENEAAFPESLAEFFVRSFCPPGGVVFDPFCGSGTSLAVAFKHGRNSVGVEIRDLQVDLSNRRLEAVQREIADSATDAD